MKKQNNPWYYYLNGSLVKKRKPAMVGDVACVDMSTYYKMVTVSFYEVVEVDVDTSSYREEKINQILD